MRVVVVGGGIIGLSTALELAARDHEITILTDLEVDATTSAVAAASFKPRMVAPDPVTSALLDASNRILAQWAGDERGHRLGLSRITHVEASATAPVARAYLHAMTDVRWLSAADGDSLPPGTSHGVSYQTWFLDVPVTLAALRADLDASTITVVDHHVAALDEAGILDLAPDVVVNAAGMGAVALTADDGMVAVRGQVVAVDRSISDVSTSVATDDAYVYPRRGDILLGGTADHLAAGDPASVARTRPDPDQAATMAILQRGGDLLRWLDPGVGDVSTWPVTTVRAGLRPWRPAGIRLELDDTWAVPVVHAYGHGGAGWTLATGTAQWVADTIDASAWVAPPTVP